jgi:hypothetical protein
MAKARVLLCQAVVAAADRAALEDAGYAVCTTMDEVDPPVFGGAGVPASLTASA